MMLIFRTKSNRYEVRTLKSEDRRRKNGNEVQFDKIIPKRKSQNLTMEVFGSEIPDLKWD